MTRIEQFLFKEGEFKYFKSVVLPIAIDDGFLLNERFVVSIEHEIFDGETIMEIYDLVQDNILVYRKRWSFAKVQYIAIDGVAFMISNTVRKFAFTDEGTPFVVDVLNNIRLIGLDCTPDDNHFIISQCNELFTCSVCNGELVKNPFVVYLPKSHIKTDISRIFDVIIQSSSEYDHHNSVYCESWNFLMLNDEVFCTEYDAATGCSTFFKLYRNDVDCMFVLQNRFISLNERRYNFSNFPITLDLFSNSITLLVPSKLNFEGHILRCTDRFYDINTQKWCSNYVTECNDYCYLYSNEKKVAEFKKPEEFEIRYISFNNFHFVALNECEQNFGVIINDLFLCRENVRCLRVAGDSVWFIRDDRVVELHVLNGSTIFKSKEINIGAYVDRFLVNPYCPEECFIDCDRQSFFLRFNYELNDFALFQVKGRCSPCFLDRSLLLVNGKIIMFGTNDVDSVTDVSFIKGALFSPMTRVVIGFTDFECYKVKMHIMRVDVEHNYVVETRNIEFFEFLSNCNISSKFTSFNCF
ncbi:hypothetical protein PCE1_004558 [Barthelona sp. PCE]